MNLSYLLASEYPPCLHQTPLLCVTCTALNMALQTHRPYRPRHLHGHLRLHRLLGVPVGPARSGPPPGAACGDCCAEGEEGGLGPAIINIDRTWRAMVSTYVSFGPSPCVRKKYSSTRSYVLSPARFLCVVADDFPILYSPASAPGRKRPNKPFGCLRLSCGRPSRLHMVLKRERLVGRRLANHASDEYPTKYCCLKFTTD